MNAKWAWCHPRQNEAGGPPWLRNRSNRTAGPPDRANSTAVGGRGWRLANGSKEDENKEKLSSRSVKHLKQRTAISLASFLLLLLSEVSAIAHHGPFSRGEDGVFHPLHLGKAQLADSNGKIVTYGIRADNLEGLSFAKPWFGCSLVTCSTPFTVPTSQIIAFGPGSFDDKSEGSAGSALTVGLAVFAPLLLIPLGLAKGQSSFQYTLANFSTSGRIRVKNIRLYSSSDVEYLTKYLEEATRKKAGDQPTSAELQRLRDNILLQQESEIKDLFQKTRSTTRTGALQCREISSTAEDAITQDIKQKIEDFNDTRKASGLDPVEIKDFIKYGGCNATPQ